MSTASRRSGAAALLALADQRLPSGGHVHSGGVEQAVAGGLLSEEVSLGVYLERRLRSAGLVAAAIAAATVRAVDGGSGDTTWRGEQAPVHLAALDVACDVRTPSPALRAASRAQGRGLLRLCSAAWAAPSAHTTWSHLGARPHHPIVLGCAAAAAGASPEEAALVVAYLAVSGPATAAQRLLALDPVGVATVTLDLGSVVEQVAEQAAAAARNAIDPNDLPDESDPLLDLLAERHAAREERLFAS